MIKVLSYDGRLVLKGGRRTIVFRVQDTVNGALSQRDMQYSNETEAVAIIMAIGVMAEAIEFVQVDERRADE